MADIAVTHQSASGPEVNEFDLRPGEVLALIFIRRLDGTVELEREQTYDKSDLSSHPDDLAHAGTGVMMALQEANKA